MTKRRKLVWTAAILTAAVAGAGVGTAVWADPLKLPGSHTVEVYAQDDELTGETQRDPGLFRMCDADTYYAEEGDRKLCIVLSGPLGEVEAQRKDGKVTVAAGDVAGLERIAAANPGATTLVLMGSGPSARIPVTSLVEGQPVTVPALR
ncbi:hypothetical protein [Paractinoplanes abujensis]|uniref:Uncharacterized protein n=1 Tax=Paractinoplanes abujensis TaxID=882441 RepID=A0A7W7D170_9ACTN|nr:hypothetical protein [Actinoplanes abujensis]MBB4698367.1 hypothetical protein [Actinoplanes abujensis]